MGPGAILVVRPAQDARNNADALGLGPLECVDVAGRSLLERMVERLAAIDVDCITILVPPGVAHSLPSFRIQRRSVKAKVVQDSERGIRTILSSYAQEGLAHAFVCNANAYTETDLHDLYCFHRESRQAVTPTFNSRGSLPLWLADCGKADLSKADELLGGTRQSAASKYFVREYVNCVASLRDLRNFAADILSRRCETDPSGRQVRPGVWLDDGAKVHRRARIVAPAYIGRDTEIQADALITRLSSIEKNCCVESGSVIEDSSVLANTNIGICLDLCHSVANGSKLFNSERDVTVEISDERVMRATARRPFATASPDIHLSTTSEPKPMPQTGQMENI